MTTWHSISQLILPIVSQSPLIRPKLTATSHQWSAGQVLLMAIGQPWLTAILSSLSKVLPRSIENLAVVLVWKENGRCCRVKLVVCGSRKVVVWCETRMVAVAVWKQRFVVTSVLSCGRCVLCCWWIPQAKWQLPKCRKETSRIAET